MTDLVTSVSASEYTANAQLVRSILLERDPSAPVQPGTAVDALVVQNQALLAAVHEARLKQVSDASTLAAMVAEGSTATEAEVDAKAADYFITRTPAVRATGSVRIVVTSNSSFVIPAGFRVSLSTLKFTTLELHRFYPSTTPGVVETATAKKLVARSDGKYEASITVTASQDGAASRLAAGTALTIDTATTGMFSASVLNDFTGGTAKETNQELLSRVLTGVTKQTLGGGNDHIAAFVSSLFPGTISRAVGTGSSLFTRDKGNLLGISTGGKYDLYVKPSSAVQYTTLTVTGTVTNATLRTVSATLNASVAAGIYRVLFIRPSSTVGTGGNSATTVTITPDIGSGWVPVMPSGTDAAFSARQVLTVEWTDTLGTGVYTVGQSRTYSFDVAYVPNVAAIDTALVADTVRPAGIDILVRGGVPCVTSVNMTVYTPSKYARPDEGVLRSAIVNKINSLPFGTESLASYTLHTAVAAVAPNSTVVATSIGGVIYAPTGIDVSLASGSSITIPTSGINKHGPDNTYFSSNISAVSLLLT